MPFIDVSLGAGRSPEQVRALIHELTEAARRAVGAPKESIRVVIREIQPDHWAAGDITVAERQAAATIAAGRTDKDKD
jgi:4-oxalocrotonate tautomerase